MSKRRKKKLPGHYCWCCGRRRANERFSGRGHRNHLCRDCVKLGEQELAYRQQVRNIDRLLDWEGRIRHKCRTAFERYLAHSDPRVREYATTVQHHNEDLRREWREMLEAERLEEERWAQCYDDGAWHDGDDANAGVARPWDDANDGAARPWEGEEIPF